MQIRRATLQDAPVAAALAGRLFRETYGGRVPSADLEAHVAEALSPEAFHRLLRSPGTGVLLVGDHQGPAGYAHLATRPCVVDPEAADAEICRFYLDAAHHGTGLADFLMEACRTWRREEGRQRLWLQVWEESPRARRFYARVGFQEAGETTYTVGTRTYRDRVLLEGRPASGGSQGTR